MKSSLKIYCVLLPTVLVFCGSAAAASFERYKVIVERHPFAAAVESESETMQDVVTVTKPPAFVQDLRLCAITAGPGGTKVGFVNTRSKKPLAGYYLFVGETSEDGIELVQADYDKGAALLRKGGEQYWLYMNAGNSASSSGENSSSGAATIADRKSSALSYAARRRARIEESRRKADEERRRADEEVARKLLEYQRERMRRGLTPLPVDLSQDAAVQIETDELPPLPE